MTFSKVLDAIQLRKTVLKVKENKTFKTSSSISNSIRVMSFNIHLKDCEDQKPKECLWSYRKEFVASMISFHNMDIIGLQEPTIEQLNDLNNLLPQYSWVGCGLDDGKNKGQIDAIFYLKVRFEILESSQFYLSETPDEISIGWDAKFIRGVTWAKFKDLKTNEVFYFFNTHFDYHSYNARNNSAILLKEKVKKISQNFPVIITGDFNLFPSLNGEDTYKILTQDNFFIDAQYKTLLPHHGPTGSWSGFKEAGQPGVKPDYIFVNSKISVKTHGILADTFDGKFPSYHLPVVSEVEIFN